MSQRGGLYTGTRRQPCGTKWLPESPVAAKRLGATRTDTGEGRIRDGERACPHKTARGRVQDMWEKGAYQQLSGDVVAFLVRAAHGGLLVFPSREPAMATVYLEYNG